jgi:hypothetical protein
MILRGKVSNIDAPVAYSAWNLPPSQAFTSFVSNPPAGDSGLGLRVRPSPEEVSALVASLGEIPDDERRVHFEVPLNPSDAEISVLGVSTPGVPGPTSKLSLCAPAQMGWRETEHRGGETVASCCPASGWMRLQ